MNNRNIISNRRVLARRSKEKLSSGLLLTMLSLLSLQSIQAGSATWNLDPVSGDWNTATNWMPNTVPNGSNDDATFSSSNLMSVTVPVKITVNSIIFDAAASAYTITATSSRPMTISGPGISNLSGVEQHFQINPAAAINFTSSATIAASTVINVLGSPDLSGLSGLLLFADSSSAGEATVFTDPTNGVHPAGISFAGSSTAASAIITNKGIDQTASFGGVTQFFNTSTAGESTITCEGAARARGGSNGGGGNLYFYDHSSADSATIIANGGTDSAAFGGFVQFLSTGPPLLASSTLIANGGVNGGLGGSIVVGSRSPGARPRVKLFGNGNFNIIGEVTIGSVEGDGLLYLGGANLTVGVNGVSTVFSGIIQDGGFSMSTGGSLTKTGMGTLTLTGANLYTGGTTVSQGTLVLSNQSGSATGTEAVQVNAGTLGGSGIVSGAVTVGTGSGTGAFLTPAVGTKRPTIFTMQSALILQADATYTYTAKTKDGEARTDKVVANGVTINQAIFSFRLKGPGALPAGLVFTVIDNTAGTPMAGTFSNLADGAIITAGGNNFQANYTGGDGNDLTLTVVP